MLDDLIEAWLTAPAYRFALFFPRRLEERFEADTGSKRSRALMVFGTIGFMLGTALYPVMQADLPDVAHLSRLLYFEISMPLGFLIAASMWLSPPPAVREGLTLLANLVCACVTIFLFSRSHDADPPLFVAAVEVLLIYSAVGVQLRFPYALASVLTTLVSYWAALRARGDISVVRQDHLVIVVAATGAYLMLANWRLERSRRRGYLLMLRERLQRQDLSLRNIELDELARRDPLTGLANRRAYDAWLAAAWAQESGQGERGERGERGARGRLGLVVLDVDRFKAFNDCYGHAAGDSCLKQIALCLREQLRGTTDLVARLGGEEFAVLLPGLSEAHCADVAERMRLAVQRLELPHSGLGPHGLVTISAGVASHTITTAHTSGLLFEAADSALYQAKVSGRNRVCVATSPAALPDAPQLLAS